MHGAETALRQTFFPPISENVSVDMRANKIFSDLMTALDGHALR